MPKVFTPACHCENLFLTLLVLTTDDHGRIGIYNVAFISHEFKLKMLTKTKILFVLYLFIFIYYALSIIGKSE